MILSLFLALSFAQDGDILDVAQSLEPAEDLGTVAEEEPGICENEAPWWGEYAFNLLYFLLAGGGAGAVGFVRQRFWAPPAGEIKDKRIALMVEQNDALMDALNAGAAWRASKDQTDAVPLAQLVRVLNKISDTIDSRE